MPPKLDPAEKRRRDQERQNKWRQKQRSTTAQNPIAEPIAVEQSDGQIQWVFYQTVNQHSIHERSGEGSQTNLQQIPLDSQTNPSFTQPNLPSTIQPTVLDAIRYHSSIAELSNSLNYRQPSFDDSSSTDSVSDDDLPFDQNSLDSDTPLDKEQIDIRSISESTQLGQIRSEFTYLSVNEQDYSAENYTQMDDQIDSDLDDNNTSKSHSISIPMFTDGEDVEDPFDNAKESEQPQIVSESIPFRIWEDEPSNNQFEREMSVLSEPNLLHEIIHFPRSADLSPSFSPQPFRIWEDAWNNTEDVRESIELPDVIENVPNSNRSDGVQSSNYEPVPFAEFIRSSRLTTTSASDTHPSSTRLTVVREHSVEESEREGEGDDGAEQSNNDRSIYESTTTIPPISAIQQSENSSVIHSHTQRHTNREEGVNGEKMVGILNTNSDLTVTAKRPRRHSITSTPELYQGRRVSYSDSNLDICSSTSPSEYDLLDYDNVIGWKFNLESPLQIDPSPEPTRVENGRPSRVPSQPTRRESDNDSSSDWELNNRDLSSEEDYTDDNLSVEEEELEADLMVNDDQTDADSVTSEELLEAQLNGPMEVDEADLEVDLPAQLAQHLIQFQGCTAVEHEQSGCSLSDDEYQSDLHHLTILDLCNWWDSAGLPENLETRVCNDYEEPNWQFIFEGVQKENRPPNDSESTTNSGLFDEEETSNNHRTKVQRTSTRIQSGIHVCMDCSETVHDNSVVFFDIDSFIAFPRSLLAAKQGLLVTFFPSFSLNLQYHLKVTLPVFLMTDRGERIVQAPIHRIPYYCWGRVAGHEDIAVYIIFPRMYDPAKSTNFPGKNTETDTNHLQIWTDSILIPAIFKYIPASSRQHFPYSWRHAQSKSLSKWLFYGELSDDQRVFGSQSFNLHFFLQPQLLGRIWDEVERTLQNPLYTLFHGALILWSCKNTKIQFASSNLADTWNAFYNSMNSAVNFGYIDEDKCWIDLGKETVSRNWDSVSRMTDEQIDVCSTTKCNLLKTCCQTKFSRWAEHSGGKKAFKATFYPVAMLQDVCDVTLEMSRNSKQREAGWVFSQSYNSIKELYSTVKTKPFDRQHLGQLAWDSKVRDMLYRLGKGVSASRIKAISKGFERDRKFLEESLLEARRVSFGVREEHRISLTFLDKMANHLREHGYWETNPHLSAYETLPFYHLPNKIYMDYLRRNATKFTAAIDWISHLNPDGRISYDNCKVLTMLLYALPMSFDTCSWTLKQEIWQRTIVRRTDNTTVWGMNAKSQMAIFKYAWFGSLIDWDSFTFRDQFALNSAFNRRMLWDTYRKNWQPVKAAKDDLGRLELVERVLKLYPRNRTVIDWIVVYSVDFLMHSYRKEVFRHFKEHIRPESVQAAISGRIPLCLSAIREHFKDDFVDKIRIISPGRTSTKTINDITLFLWGSSTDCDLERRGWESAPFRTFACRLYEIFAQELGTRFRNDFLSLVRRHFIVQHWLFPQPTKSRFVTQNKAKSFQFYGVWHDAASRSGHIQTGNWSRELQWKLSRRDTITWVPRAQRGKANIRRLTNILPLWHLESTGSVRFMMGMIDLSYPERTWIDSSLSSIMHRIEGIVQESGQEEVEGMVLD